MSTGRQLEKLRAELGELVEDRAGPSLSAFEAYRDRPVAFVRDVLHGEPWSAQRTILDGLRDVPLLAIRGGNSAGKGWTLARAVLWWVYARRGMAVVSSATGRQTRDTFWREVRKAFGRSELPGTLYEAGLVVDRVRDVAAYAVNTDAVSRMTGYHSSSEGGLLVVLDEMQGCPDHALEAALSMATAERDRIVAAGNPLHPSGPFWRISQPSSGWKALAIDVRDHPNIREDRVAAPGGPSPGFVERIAKTYGRESGTFRARVMGEFPTESSEGLFRVSWIDAAVERWHQGEGADVRPSVSRGVSASWGRRRETTYRTETRDAGVTLGVDPARHGPDETVVAIVRGSRCERFETWSRCDLMESVERIQRLAADVKREYETRPRLVVDEVGVGGGIVDRLRELGVSVSAYNGGKRPKDTDRYLNKRAEDFWALRELLEAGKLAIPDDDKLRGEMVALSWTPTGSGQVQVQAKAELRGLIGRSPDRLDALVMALAPSRAVSAVWSSRNRETVPAYHVSPRRR